MGTVLAGAHRHVRWEMATEVTGVPTTYTSLASGSYGLLLLYMLCRVCCASLCGVAVAPVWRDAFWNNDLPEWYGTVLVHSIGPRD